MRITVRERGKEEGERKKMTKREISVLYLSKAASGYYNRGNEMSIIAATKKN